MPLTAPNFFLAFMHLRGILRISFRQMSLASPWRDESPLNPAEMGAMRDLSQKQHRTWFTCPALPSGDPPLPLFPSLSLLGLQAFHSPHTGGSYSPEKAAWVFPQSKGLLLSPDLSSLEVVPESGEESYLTSIAHVGKTDCWAFHSKKRKVLHKSSHIFIWEKLKKFSCWCHFWKNKSFCYSLPTDNGGCWHSNGT